MAFGVFGTKTSPQPPLISFIDNWTHRNKLQRNLDQNSKYSSFADFRPLCSVLNVLMEFLSVIQFQHISALYELYLMSQHHIPLLWRNNDRDGVSNHQSHDCLLNRLFRRGSRKTSKLRVTSLCAANSPVTGEFPAQRASNAEFFSIWWRHHALRNPIVAVGWKGIVLLWTAPSVCIHVSPVIARAPYVSMV